MLRYYAVITTHPKVEHNLYLVTIQVAESDRLRDEDEADRRNWTRMESNSLLFVTTA
jgi:hypothetical protein